MQTDQPLTDAERTLPPHLGGHFGQTNMDEATLVYLCARYKIHFILDVGCGPGGMVDLARDRGYSIAGIDGDTTVTHPFIAHHDYAAGPYAVSRDEPTIAGWISALIQDRDFDLIWCTEFVEHVEQQYEDNYLATFDAGRVLFLTAAPPGFPGWHHVNCQPESYWIERLAARGWALDTEATQWVRANGGHIFSQRQGLVFVKGY
jgi:SAM-dependent methyltransferase